MLQMDSERPIAGAPAADFTVIVPTLNAGPAWRDWIERLVGQSIAPHKVLVIDSSSEDATAALARQAGFEVHVIPRAQFNHGATRQFAFGLAGKPDIAVFLTQDALLSETTSLEDIVRAFADPEIGLAYGRQLPYPDASPISAHARLFNYPPKSDVRSRADARRLGFKAAFASNSFAAYRGAALEQVGGFPARCILSEDIYVAAKMLLAGWKVSYCAEATVAHSHNYSIGQEFRRYFDQGVFVSRESWISRELGGPTGAGKDFVLSEAAFLAKEHPLLLPAAAVRTAAKFVGYKLGCSERMIPLPIKKKLSMHSRFWD